MFNPMIASYGDGHGAALGSTPFSSEMSQSPRQGNGKGHPVWFRRDWLKGSQNVTRNGVDPWGTWHWNIASINHFFAGLCRKFLARGLRIYDHRTIADSIASQLVPTPGSSGLTRKGTWPRIRWWRKLRRSWITSATPHDLAKLRLEW